MGELKRSPMKRTEFKPSAPKPANGPRAKKCKNRACRASFVPSRPFIEHCTPECGVIIGMEKVAKQKAAKAKAERAADKAKLAQYRRRSDWVADAQRAFNAFIRERDKDKPCICCGRAETSVDGLGAHGWDCGHYRSTGSAPFLRFNEDNAHRQLVFCNRNRAGNAVEYRIGLIARIGLERVEALECNNAAQKWSVEELKAIKAHYVTELKKLKGSA